MLQELLAVGLPRNDYALFGSGPLLARGWIDVAGDLDVLARGAAWSRASVVGRPEHLELYGVDVVTIGDSITIGTSWGIGDFDVDSLIDEAELIGGIPCVLLEHVIAYKRIANRPKDRMHLKIIDERRAAGGR